MPPGEAVTGRAMTTVRRIRSPEFGAITLLRLAFGRGVQQTLATFTAFPSCEFLLKKTLEPSAQYSRLLFVSSGAAVHVRADHMSNLVYKLFGRRFLVPFYMIVQGTATTEALKAHREPVFNLARVSTEFEVTKFASRLFHTRVIGTLVTIAAISSRCSLIIL